MRSELTTLEQIDLYLSGDLSSADKAAFENKMANDSALKEQVTQQQELIRVVNRQALRAQISSVAASAGGAAGGGGLSNLFLGISGIVTVGLITVGAIYFYPQGEDKPAEDIAQIENDQNQLTNDSLINAAEIAYQNEGVLLEEPETIFSSNINYEMLETDDVNTVVRFQSQGVGEEVDYENISDNRDNGVLIVKEDERKPIEVDEFETTERKSRARRARFPGGNIAMDKFIDKNLNYPRSAYNKSIEGVVRCNFHVSADGVISEIDAKCIKMSERDGAAFNDVRLMMNKKIMKAFINNATHILRTMPIWEPARNSEGNPILSAQRMYFNYDMEQGCLVYQLDDDVQISNESKKELELIIGEFDKGKHKRWSIGKANK